MRCSKLLLTVVRPVGPDMQRQPLRHGSAVSEPEIFASSGLNVTHAGEQDLATSV